MAGMNGIKKESKKWKWKRMTFNEIKKCDEKNKMGEKCVDWK